MWFHKKEQPAMNPMVQAVVGSVVRWGLGLLAGHFMTTAISDGDIKEVTGAIVAAIALGWSLYQKYHGRQVLVTALSSGPMSEQTAKALVASPIVETPSVTTSSHDVPAA
jgi:hypothetical protein